MLLENAAVLSAQQCWVPSVVQSAGLQRLRPTRPQHLGATDGHQKKIGQAKNRLHPKKEFYNLCSVVKAVLVRP